MTSSYDIKGTSGYCDRLFNELDSVKNRLVDLKVQAEHSTSEHAKVHATLLADIIKTLEWKEEILLRDCTIEFKADVGSPSVREYKEEFSGGGFVGG